MDFTRINFGRADAHSEGEDFPILLKDGYLDIDSVVDQALNTSVFLFLGYKGSGKSSLSEHLRLKYGEELIDQQGLNNFPFKLFDKVIDSPDKNIRYKSTWRWLLSVKAFQNLYKDTASFLQTDENLHKVFETLTQAGIFPLITISSLVKKTVTNSVYTEINKIGLSHSSQKVPDSSVDYEMATDYLIDLLRNFKEENKHIIIIDDLDDILSPNGLQFGILTALINEAKDLNRIFSRSNIPVKILVLCRTDMFERFVDPNMNKIKQDSSFTFTWYREGVDSHKASELVNLINKRAKLTYPEVLDVFNTFFPQRYQGVSIRKSLLNYTRHTPRDFIQLMNHIQSNCNAGTENVTGNEIVKGINDYSTEYFKQEIADEMAGYFTHEMIEGVFNVLASLHKKYFTFHDFAKKKALNQKLRNISSEEILETLYNCSAIGHIYEGGDYTFKYRNRASSFDPESKISVHRGLWKVLNIS